MPLFFFHLNDGTSGVADPQGTPLADLVAAQEHAQEVALELMAHAEGKHRHWLLEVCAEDGTRLFDLPFETVDQTIRRFHPQTKRLIEEACRIRRASAKAIREARATVRRARALVARSRGLPWLVADGGCLVGGTIANP